MGQQSARTFPPFFLKRLGSLATKTESEKILWSYLIKKPSGFEFSQQYPIHHFIADFFCIELCLVIEIRIGNHERPELSENDIKKEEWLVENGFAILRFTNFEIERALEKVTLTIENKIKLIAGFS